LIVLFSVYTHYACTVLMFLFGLKMLWEAWRMSDDEAADIEHEVREELERRCSISSNRSLRSQEEGQEGAGGQMQEVC
jgi:putative Mn2+ efflux pump MntP